jgi:anaerobic selenocysteine-containing dehydrogenase
MSTETIHYRACPLCEAICGLKIKVRDGAVAEIRGDTQDPFSRGHICPKAVALRDIQDDPDRLRGPVLRVGTAFVPVSWDDAFATAAKGLAAILRANGPNAVATYLGNPVAHNHGLFLAARGFLGAIGSRQRYSASSVDQVPQQIVVAWMYGHPLLVPIPDLDRTRYFLVMGANPLVSNGSLMTVPDVGRRLADLRARGGKLVVIDPRRTETAAIADEHHFIRPGTDAALLAAMLATLIEEDLVRPGRLEPMLEGWATARDALREFSADRAGPVTGIPAATIRRLARDFAAAEAGICYGRFGLSTQRHGTLCQWLIQLLNIATGNLDRPGGILVTKPAFELVPPGPKTHWGRWKSRVRGLPEALGEFPVATLADEILTPGEGQIRALVTMAGNPVLSTSNGPRLDAALGGLDFMVSLDLYVNETTRRANVILPPTSPLEHDGYDAIFNAFAIRNVARWNDAVLPKPTDSRHDWEILAGLGAALAAELGLPIPSFPTPDALLRAGLASGPWRLDAERLAAAPHGIDLGPLEPSFPERLTTVDKRVRCAPSPMLEALATLQTDLFDAAAPALALIGRRDIRSNNSWMHNAPRLVKGKDRCQLLMHPQDLADRGIGDGDRVRLSSRAGAVEVRVEASADMMPGVVSLPHGWGHDRAGARLGIARAVAGVSANDVTDETLIDPISGNAALNGVPVAVTAV